MSRPAAPARPRLLLPAVLTVVGVAVLCGLGAWQWQRMGEKRAFISRLETQAQGPAAPLPPAGEWPRLDLAALDLTRSAARGSYLDGIASVRTTIAAGPPGSRQLSGFGRWVFQGFRLEDGATILINRGFVPEDRFATVAPASGPATVTGFLRAPEERGSFTPADLPGKREFYTRDPAAIAAALGIGTVAPFYLEAERQGDGLTPPAGVDARELIARIPDNHLQYALTWWGLALTLIGVFGAYARQARAKPAQTE
ncbi:SURF1 family cytochrome oxidase biogenesis protein [Bosea sp. CS1GBMeth4]|uniref:SURF1 family protein n=1 Tax=Bosea sp. CS1GBMeth4 TaxID=1892849 RepID=UPI001646CD00|nr:SURF1 family cytochrome oxidase biogenesis protein [Bosea sp. CS1GBMeth4]